jgi:predicted CXXCH cytochrome family protein
MANAQPQGKEGRLVRRLAIFVMGGAVWLLLAAIPVLADGGPHVMSYNNGSSGIKADGCASCHRIHTSQSPTGYLLTSNEATVTGFCRSCHGATGTGASTDVDTGVQYPLDGIVSVETGTTVGALRGGGFIEARIGSDAAYRLVSNTGSVSSSKVPVAADPQPVTSAHLALGPLASGGNGLTSKNKVWGNGALGSPGVGPTLASEMECTACHNPHGNGNYRILNGIPDPGATVPADGLFPVTIAVNVKDATFDPARTRNYTVIQVAGTVPAGDDPTPAEEATWLLYADQVIGIYDPLSGDYLHKAIPYNAASTVLYPFDAPNARPNINTRTTTIPWWRGDARGFNMQMTAWCAQCHTRYMAASGSRVTLANGGNGTGGVDAIYSYRHTTAYNRTCTTCHVAHGTNAVMNRVPADGTTYSANVPYPDGTIPDGTTADGNSRLLKVNNRGTCQLCHDPTDGSAANNAVPPVTSIGQGPIPSFLP